MLARTELSSSTTSEDAGGEAGPIRAPLGHPHTLRADKMVRFKGFATREDALEAAGLSE